jgi:threonine dehydrogenase-like Zn-dependent dehydrogenase
MLSERRNHVVGITVEAPRRLGYRTFSLDRTPDTITTHTVTSLISPGTELVPFAPPDSEAVRDITYPVLKSGYANTAYVTEVRDTQTGIKEGTRVSVSTGHRTGDTVDLRDRHRYIKLPDDIDDEVGALAVQMMPIALTGIITAADQLHRKELRTLEGSLKGQKIAVNGAGPIGLLVAEGLRYAGAEAAIMVDEWPQRLALAEEAGMTSINFREEASVPQKIKEIFSEPRIIRGINYKEGADYFINTAPDKQGLANALESLRKQGKVIDMAFYPEEVGVALGGTFHHDGKAIIAAQIQNQPEGQQPKWNRRRLAEVGFEILQDRGEHIRRSLLKKKAEFKDAQEVFEDYASKNPDRLVTVFTPGDVSTLPIISGREVAA